MDEQGLKKFVENMRANSMPDEEIERNLQIAGHNQKLIDSLLGKTPEQQAGVEHRQSDEPIIDPNNRPQIIKDRSAILEKQMQPTTEEAQGTIPPTEATTAGLPSAADKLKINPQTAGLEPASINSPSTQAPPKETTPTPTPAPTAPAPEASVAEPAPAPVASPAPPIDQNPNSVDAVTAAAAPVPNLGMPQPPNPAPEAPKPIYPEASKGHVAHMQTAPNPLAGPAPTTEPFPEFISNPFVLLLDSVKKFATNAPFLIGAILIGSALALGFTRLVVFLSTQAAKLIGDSGAANSLLGDGGWGSIIGLYIIVILIYDVFIALYVSLYRTLQLSITLDIAKGDRPDFGGAFNRMFSWFTRIFAANLRLIIKLSIVVAIAGLILLWMIISAFSGSLTINSPLPLYVLLYGSLFIILLIMVRNSFVHLLMLENGTNRPSDSARDSITMVKQPRQKYFELFAWLGIATILYSVFSIVQEMLFPLSNFGSSGILTFDFNTELSATDWGRDIIGALFVIVIVSIHDLGVSRHFVTARGLLKSAGQIGSINPLNFIVIVVAIASVWGSSRIVSDMRTDRYLEEYEESFQSQQNESSDRFRTNNFESTFDPDDWDNNGIPDDEQCGDDSFAVPDFVEYNEETRESIYTIECL